MGKSPHRKEILADARVKFASQKKSAKASEIKSVLSFTTGGFHLPEGRILIGAAAKFVLQQPQEKGIGKKQIYRSAPQAVRVARRAEISTS